MHGKQLFAATALLASIAVSAYAQKQQPPEGSAPKDFALPARTSFTMDNGLSFTLVPFGTLPKVHVRAVVRTGNVHEGPGEIWLADLTGDMMKEGTTTRSAKAMAEEAARMGGSIDINVGEDLISVTAEVLSEFGPDIVALLGDVLRNPALPESELARLKNDRLRELSITRSQPNSIALERFRKVLYGNHPYGRLFPTEQMIEGYTVQHIRTFHRMQFGAARTHLYVAGKFDTRAMERAIRTAFDGWERGPEPAANMPKPASERSIHILDRPGAPQSTTYLGLPTIDPSHPQYRKLLVMNAILGGSFSSRITSNIRENKGYTYSPGSAVSARYRDAYWAQFASITTEVTGPALKEIFHEIKRLQQEPPSEEELRGIKNYLAGVFVLQNSSMNGIVNQLVFLNLHGLPDSYLTDYVKTIHAVTPREVSEMARTYIRDGEITIVIAGDRKKVEQQVAPFGRISG